jgi:uncharacterized membrane protein YeaQ/YmgE (transglycosylase-associated protein family)
MVKQAVGSMSGGEKARLVLCMIVWQRPNLLLLDEPTNHLDLATREALAMALNEFEGTVMLVSHDRALLRSVCDEFWLVSPRRRRALRRRPGRLPALPAGRSQAHFEKQSHMMSLLGTLFIGLIVGFIARAVKPGDDKLGWIMTALLGIAGSFVANYVGAALGLYKGGDAAGFIASVIGAVVLLFIYGLIKGKST